MNEWLRKVAGQEFSAKDFRTWAGSLAFVAALRGRPPGRSALARRKDVLAALDVAAALLHNTPSVCRASYVHPALVKACERGTLARSLERRGPRARGRPAAERALLAFLRQAAGGQRARDAS